MKLRTWACVGVACGASLLGGAGLRQNATNLAVAISWSGSTSAVAKGRIERVSDQARWDAVRKEHCGPRIELNALGFPVVPTIDFERFEVICGFSGTRVNLYQWSIDSVQDLGEVVRVRFDQVGFQTASFDGQPDKGVTTSAYGFFVVPRTAKEIVMEENTQGRINGPPVWTERVRLAAKKGG
jgi:hypothetical protein